MSRIPHDRSLESSVGTIDIRQGDPFGRCGERIHVAMTDHFRLSRDILDPVEVKPPQRVAQRHSQMNMSGPVVERLQPGRESATIRAVYVWVDEQFRTADLAALAAEGGARAPQEHSLSRSSVSVHSSRASSQRPRAESAIANLAR